MNDVGCRCNHALDVCMIHAMRGGTLLCYVVNDAVRLHVVSMHNVLCCCKATLLFWRCCAITCCFDAQRSLLLPCCATVLRGCATFLAMVCDYMLFRCITLFVVAMLRYPTARLRYFFGDAVRSHVVSMHNLLCCYHVALPCCEVVLRCFHAMLRSCDAVLLCGDATTLLRC